MQNHLLMQDFIKFIIESGYRDEYPHVYTSCGSFFTFSPTGASAKVQGEKIPLIYIDSEHYQLIKHLQFRCSASIDPTTKKLLRNVYAFIEYKSVPKQFRALCPKSTDGVQAGIEIQIRALIYPDLIGRRVRYIDQNKWNLRSKNIDSSVPSTVKRYQSAPIKDHRIGKLKRGACSMNPPSSEAVAEFSGMSSIDRGDREKAETQPIAKPTVKKTPVSRTRKDPFFGMVRSKDRKKIRLTIDRKHLGTFDTDENGVVLLFAARDSYCSQNNQDRIPHPNLTQISLWLARKT